MWYVLCSDFLVDSDGNVGSAISAHYNPYSVCSHGATYVMARREIGVRQTEFLAASFTRKHEQDGDFKKNDSNKRNEKAKRYGVVGI